MQTELNFNLSLNFEQHHQRTSPYLSDKTELDVWNEDTSSFIA